MSLSIERLLVDVGTLATLHRNRPTSARANRTEVEGVIQSDAFGAQAVDGQASEGQDV